MAAWEEAAYIINSVVNKTKDMLVKGGLIDESENPSTTKRYLITDDIKFDGNTKQFDCSQFDGHEKWKTEKFNIVPGMLADFSASGFGNTDLDRYGNVKITAVSYSSPLLTISGNDDSGPNLSGVLHLPLYYIN